MSPCHIDVAVYITDVQKYNIPTTYLKFKYTFKICTTYRVLLYNKGIGTNVKRTYHWQFISPILAETGVCVFTDIAKM